MGICPRGLKTGVILGKFWHAVARGKLVCYREEEWGALKEFKYLDLLGARLSWRINGLGDPTRAS